MVALVGVVGMAFRVSWNALRDVAGTVGADDAAAALYPFVVDGLMALALVATLALTGRDRRFALRVLAGYTLASLSLNYVHGLVPAMRTGQRMYMADWAPANYVLVLLATSLPVGAIYFGSDLVAKVLHHHHEPVPDAAYGDGRTEGVRLASDGGQAVSEGAGPDRTPESTGLPVYGVPAQVSGRTPASGAGERTSDVQRPRTPVRPTQSKSFDEAELERTRQRAEQTYAESLTAGSPIGPAALGRAFGFSEGWGRKRIKAVEARRAEPARQKPPTVSAVAHG
ncbi:hypothetical protein Sm713_16420 [Streptomyces sp. TS71-3]|nr:hypothetical protein Sm713_16420 [Streptomyces sp. TS71-3]